MKTNIKFDIDPNLDRFWKIIGFSKEEREIEIRRLSDILHSAYEKFVKDVSIECQHLYSEVVETQNEFKNLLSVYHDKTETMPITNDMPLLKQLEVSKNALDYLKMKYEPREKEFKDVKAQIMKYFNLLGVPIKERQKYIDVGENDRSDEILKILKERLDSLQKEAENRTVLLNNINESIMSLSNELDEELPDEMSEIFENEKYDNESLKIADDYQEMLTSLKQERTDTVEYLNQRISYLYDLLAVDKNDQIKLPEGLSSSTIKELQKEVKFLESNMKSRLPVVVNKLREAIQLLCDQLDIPYNERPSYISDDIEETAVYLKNEYKKLTEKNMKLKPIIDLIYQRDLLIEKLNEPPTVVSKNSQLTPTKSSQFKNKRLTRSELGKIEIALFKLLLEYRSENGKDFVYGGVTVIDTIEKEKYPNDIIDSRTYLQQKMKELNMNDIEIKRHAQTPNVRKKKPMSYLYTTPPRK